MRRNDETARSGTARLDAMVSARYGSLCRLAAAYLRSEWSGERLPPTALVHEAYLRLRTAPLDGADGDRLFALAARRMRQTLLNRARDAAALKRGGGARPASLPRESSRADRLPEWELTVDLRAALAALRRRDRRMWHVVEMRFLRGMTVAQVAEALDVSPRTVEGDWARARAWLRRRLDAA